MDKKSGIQSVRLLYSAAVHFDAFDKFEDGLVTELRKKGRAQYEALIWGVTHCAEAGELLRRFYGKDAQEILSEDDWRLILMTPRAASAAMVQLIDAINHGLATEETKEDDGVDLTLQEFQKKTNDG